MSDWSWVTTAGERGEIVVKILPEKRARFVLDFVDGVRIGSYDLPEGLKLIPGDVCNLSVEITEVSEATDPTRIAVKILDVKSVRKSDQQSDAEMEAMRQHLTESK